MPDFHDRRTGEVKPLASDRAEYLQGTWMHGKGDTRAAVWTKQGVRHEGTRVSPTKDGVTLHGGLKPQKFTNDSVDEVHYYTHKND